MYTHTLIQTFQGENTSFVITFTVMETMTSQSTLQSLIATQLKDTGMKKLWWKKHKQCANNIPRFHSHLHAAHRSFHRVLFICQQFQHVEGQVLLHFDPQQ